MKKLIVIGNLGSDVEVRREEGREYLTFSIADTLRQEKDGRVIERTEWISCSFNGAHEKLVPYLKKGTKVMVVGDCGTRLFSSQKDKCMKAGLNCFVRELELVGGIPDSVPSRLYDYNGVEVPVRKYYYAAPNEFGMLYDRKGKGYQVTAEGWVYERSVYEPNEQQNSVEVVMKVEEVAEVGEVAEYEEFTEVEE